MRFLDRTAAFLTPLARGSGRWEQPLDLDATPALTRLSDAVARGVRALSARCTLPGAARTAEFMLLHEAVKELA